ncbi:Acid phosphatase type 7 [Collichthys lucidus]|uniref:Purple acid phosphatase n=1 Tax=Collichthys lucidus TaxID=240159 RepID=A0A4U5VHK4_COLLU|nr:Acid phosphatase type 7 [Collichthys lucidus]
MAPVHAACALLSLAPLLVLGVPPIWTQPEQVHLSYPGVPGSMVVTWTTFNKTETKVEYGLLGGRLFEMSAKGDRNSSTTVGSDDGWSDMFTFTALNDSTSFSPRFALYGDLGNENPQSLARLQKETQLGMYDVILHIVTPNPTLTQRSELSRPTTAAVQNIAVFLPLINFSNYRNRFSMPGQTESLWYSWNLGSAHFVSISTEVYFYLEYGQELLFKQYEWLKKDLEEANKPENRAVRPWIITMGHRPMYCSDDDQDDCTKFDSYVRLGRNDTKPPAPGLEDLFYRYGVDLELWAHEHTYERLWPVYGDKVCNGSKEQPYVNPKAPVHIITGSAGCRERTDRFNPNPKDWSAFRSTDYGYTRMQLVNATHIYLEQISDDQYGKVIDSIYGGKG